MTEEPKPFLIKTELVTVDRLVFAIDMLWWADCDFLTDDVLGDVAHRVRIVADHYAAELDRRIGDAKAS